MIFYAFLNHFSTFQNQFTRTIHRMIFSRIKGGGGGGGGISFHLLDSILRRFGILKIDWFASDHNAFSVSLFFSFFFLFGFYGPLRLFHSF